MSRDHDEYDRKLAEAHVRVFELAKRVFRPLDCISMFVAAATMILDNAVGRATRAC